MKWRDHLDLAKCAAKGWVDDRASTMGAALSYYTVFSVAPLLLIAISVAGLVFGREAAEGAIVSQIGGLVGEKSAVAIQGMLQSVAKPKEGAIATLTGVLLLLVGATTVFAELQDDLNRIWKAPPKAVPSGLWGWLRSRLLSIGLIMAIGFLLLVSLAASAALEAVDTWSTSLFGGWTLVAQAVNQLFSYGMVTALFAIIYRWMPSVRIEWRDVVMGAAVTAALFTLGKYLIGLYIGKSAVASGFGAAGSLAVILVWVYYSAQIFLLGAEFTWAFAHRYGSRQHEVPDAPSEARPPAAQKLPVVRPDVKPSPSLIPVHGRARRAAGAMAGPLLKLAGSMAVGAAAVFAVDAAARHKVRRRGRLFA